jgi:hypothetical protein
MFPQRTYFPPAAGGRDADAAYRGHLASVLARRAVTLADGSGVLVLSHGAQIADQGGMTRAA